MSRTALTPKHACPASPPDPQTRTHALSPPGQPGPHAPFAPTHLLRCIFGSSPAGKDSAAPKTHPLESRPPPISSNPYGSSRVRPPAPCSISYKTRRSPAVDAIKIHPSPKCSQTHPPSLMDRDTPSLASKPSTKGSHSPPPP